MLSKWTFSDDPAVWLSWVQGLTTIALAVLTGWYVILTRKLATSSMHQTEAALRQAEAAADSARTARRQLDVEILSAYLPIQTAVSAALGNVRAARMLPMNVPTEITPPNFDRALEAAERVGASLAATMSGAKLLLSRAQTIKNDLVVAANKFEPGHLQIEFNVKMLEAYLESLEQILNALHGELAETTHALRSSAGTRDVTLKALEVPEPAN